MKTSKLNGGSVAKTLLAGLAIFLLSSAIPNQPSKDEPGKRKIPVCHFGRMIMISPSAWPSHKAHGDNRGPCEQEPPIIVHPTD